MVAVAIDCNGVGLPLLAPPLHPYGLHGTVVAAWCRDNIPSRRPSRADIAEAEQYSNAICHVKLNPHSSCQTESTEFLSNSDNRLSCPQKVD